MRYTATRPGFAPVHEPQAAPSPTTHIHTRVRSCAHVAWKIHNMCHDRDSSVTTTRTSTKVSHPRLSKCVDADRLGSIQHLLLGRLAQRPTCSRRGSCRGNRCSGRPRCRRQIQRRHPPDDVRKGQPFFVRVVNTYRYTVRIGFDHQYITLCMKQHESHAGMNHAIRMHKH